MEGPTFDLILEAQKERWRGWMVAGILLAFELVFALIAILSLHP